MIEVRYSTSYYTNALLGRFSSREAAITEVNAIRARAIKYGVGIKFTFNQI